MLQLTIRGEGYLLTLETKASLAPKASEIKTFADAVTTLGGVEELVAKYKPTAYKFDSIEGYEVSSAPSDLIEQATKRMSHLNALKGMPDLANILKGFGK